MGSADVVPGVSGGTIAFISGIYSELLHSIKSVDLAALKTLFKQGPKAAWQQVNGTFLLVLFAGIATAILTLAKGISFLLATYPVLLWAFFFGLILASSWYISKQIKSWPPQRLLALLIGVAVAATISLIGPSNIEVSPLSLFIGGSIAICAMILPGISGSFLLLLMGLYAPVLAALKAFQFSTLIWFVLGALVGILAFARLLSWLLDTYQSQVYALLTGFMLGALVKVWPWKETVSFRQNSHGEQLPFIQHNILPDLGDGQTLALTAGCFMFGFVLVFLLEAVTQKHNS